MSCPSQVLYGSVQGKHCIIQIFFRLFIIINLKYTWLLMQMTAEEVTVQSDDNDDADCSISCASFSSSEDESDDDNIGITQHEDIDQPWTRQRFFEALAVWCTSFNIGRTALTMLLGLLYHVFRGYTEFSLPRDARTVLQTSREATKTKITAGGEYYHFGIESSISHVMQSNNIKVADNDIINLQINIDGLPVHRSKGESLWPILGIITLHDFRSAPFCLAVYCGDRKPSSAVDFLQDFVDEYCEIERNGISINSTRASVNLHAIICDAPARSFVKCTKQYGGYGACDRCQIVGERVVWKENFELRKDGTTAYKPITKTAYVKVNNVLRTDESFRSRSQPQHHHPERSPFERTRVDMVNQFVIDHMHAVWSGVARKLMHFWTAGDPSGNANPRKHMKLYHLHPNEKEEINARISSFSRTCPSEFQRRPRTLHDLNFFKATEFRSFVCYYGLAALKNVLHDSVYGNFKCLVISMRILLNPTLCKRNYRQADIFLKEFIKGYIEVYGEKHMVMNVHYLFHLADDGVRYGNLDNVSSFPFESYLCKMKRLVRKPGSTLQSVVRRIQEERRLEGSSAFSLRNKTTTKCIRPAYGGPMPLKYADAQQFECIKINGVRFSCRSERDATVAAGSEIGKIENLIRLDNGEIKVVLRMYLNKKHFFDEPFGSSDIGMHIVSNLSKGVCVRNLNECKKIWLMNHGSMQGIAIQLNHTMP